MGMRCLGMVGGERRWGMSLNGCSEICSFGIGGVWMFGYGLVLFVKVVDVVVGKSADLYIVLVNCGLQLSETSLMSCIDDIDPCNISLVTSLTSC